MKWKTGPRRVSGFYKILERLANPAVITKIAEHKCRSSFRPSYSSYIQLAEMKNWEVYLHTPLGDCHNRATFLAYARFLCPGECRGGFCACSNITWRCHVSKLSKQLSLGGIPSALSAHLRRIHALVERSGPSPSAMVEGSAVRDRGRLYQSLNHPRQKKVEVLELQRTHGAHLQFYKCDRVFLENVQDSRQFLERIVRRSIPLHVVDWLEWSKNWVISAYMIIFACVLNSTEYIGL